MRQKEEVPCSSINLLLIRRVFRATPRLFHKLRPLGSLPPRQVQSLLARVLAARPPIRHFAGRDGRAGLVNFTVRILRVGVYLR